jgi:RNA 2',3'-cyclic 3'-phosphodiesterase
MARLFFALLPSAPVGEELLERAAPLIAELGSRPVPVGNVHATLSFIGEVAEERVDALRAAALAVRASPGELCFDSLEVWEKPRILCATAPKGSAAASALADALRDAAIAAGFTPDIKDFRPHLTLAKKIAVAEAKKLSWPRDISPGFVVRFQKFALMQSSRGEHGSIYSVVDSWPLYETERL